MARWRADNRGEDYRRSKAWQDAHPEERRAQGQRAHAKAPQKSAARARLRRARLAGSDSPGVTRAEWSGVLDIFAGRCAYCLAPATDCDHVEPIARGGRDELSNVVPACKSCNSRKGDRTLLAFLPLQERAGLL
jgi:5-methylcytosine-specific restriction endonuclease McrA